MPAPFRRALPLLLLLPLAAPAYGQRTETGPPMQDPFQRPEAVPVSIGNYQAHSYQSGILTVRSTDGGSLRVRPWAEGVVRVEYFPAGTPVREIPSMSIVQAPAKWFAPGRHHEGPEAGMPKSASRAFAEGYVRATPAALEWPVSATVTVVIDKNPLRVSYRRHNETLLREAGGVFQRLTNESSGPGGTGVSFRLQPDEHLYGTGSRALPLDRRGRRLTLYNEAHYGYQNGEPTLNVSLPTVVSSRGYMLFFDHMAAGTLDLGAAKPDVLEYSNEDLLNLGYFLITGDSYAEILSRYTALTGRQPLPPRWGLGLIQSRFGYKSDAEMEQVAARMRRENFPLDALVLDLYWFGGTRQQGNFSWDYANFRQPLRMMRRLDSVGVKTLLISEPYVMRTSRHDAEVRALGLVGTHPDGSAYTVESFWAGPATILDMDKPATRDWLWNHYRRRKAEGVAGWWSDLGEPENHPTDMRHQLGGTRQVHNGLGQAWAGILQENYTREFPEERLFNLARSGWAGMQRNSVFPWSGDINRSWSGYRAQVPIMLGMGMGGVGYMHSDAGGFCVGPTDPELYTRWLQMASLGPILRPHGEGVPPEPYWWPEPYKSIVRRYTHLRYELLPYLYSLAWENNQTGAPLARPMHFGTTYVLPEAVEATQLSAQEGAAGFTATDAAWHDSPFNWNWNSTASSHWGSEKLLARKQREFAAERVPALANVNDQYLLGPSLLVAPVLQPGQRRRNVVLPAGSWVEFDTNQTYAGSRTVGLAAPLARLPLLVRAGAFLPMTPYVPSTAYYRSDSLRLRYYADPAAGRTSFTLYDDDGKSALTQRTGAFELIAFSGSTTRTQADIRIVPGGQGYEGAPAWRSVELLIPRVAAAPSAVLINNETVPATEWQYDAAGTLRLHFLLERRPVTVSVRGLRLNTAPTAALPETVTLEAPDNRTFSGPVALPYTLHAAGRPGILRIVDATGRVVRTLTPAATEAGSHTIIWHADDAQGRPVAGGVYWAELAGQRQRLVLMQ
ncbi:TIM-barrel domain-containing protein [Hymenobacter psychrotolerans]|uniref:FlgD Ig-like domain-containing protein n=1 Tax=Hymenobacter psychrotolerans DSM 18569 TaxID=1121959 RepID=A0A1M6WRR8_9BACT|nr:TIM-barrel domain-containing protein [Hymenobacter psychrotolerans]SHK96452.1 FlgD Ig-like domain-containing protein [Hymenobacter psychrotolerans DSM 18569]